MKIKYLLLSLLTPLLVSFCSADFNASSVFQLVQTWNINSNNITSDVHNWKDIFYNVNNDYLQTDTYYYCIYNNFNIDSDNVSSFTYKMSFFVWSSYSAFFSPSSYNFVYTSWNSAYKNYNEQFFCVRPFRLPYSQNRVAFWFVASDNTDFINYVNNSFVNVDYKIYKISENDYYWLLSSSSSSSDCSSVENQLSSCQSSLNTMSWSLASCQSSLSDCQWNWSHCDTLYGQCVENLSWCNADKISLQNYNDSLSSQLNSCLASLTSWENASWLYLTYNMFWQDSDSMFSLPITNNLFLPTWYKWKLDDDNVLSIAKLNNLEAAYMFSDDDKVNIIDLLSMVMLFLLATWSLIWLIVFLKRLVIKK